MTAADVFDAYEKHLADVDREFRRVADRFSDRMQCRKGCSMCCSQMFSISLIEAAFISRAVKALPDDERARLQAAAREYLDRAPVGDDGQESILPRPGLRIPCPALKDDACSVYHARPIICHKWGIPVFNPVKPLELQACELNFRPGEAIDVDGLLEPQVALLEDWIELKKRAAAPRERATVAEAILFDYEALLK